MAQEFAGGLPPQDLEAEQVTLGSILLDAGAAARAIAILSPDDFYREAHRIIYAAMLAVHMRGEPVDLITVSNELRRRGQYERVGGAEYLTALIHQVPTAAHVVRYATLVQEKAVLRNLARAGAQIQAMALEDPEDVGATLDAAEQMIFEIAQKRVTTDFAPLGPEIVQTFEKLDELSRRPSFVTGVPTGIPDFDRMTAGLQRGDLIIVAGRPSMGKTSLAVCNFALHAAVQHGIPVAIFSLEMSREQLAEMVLCAEAKVDAWRLRRGDASQEDWTRIGHALSYLPEAPLYIDDTPSIHILELRSKARRMKSQYDIGLVVVDYLQLVRASGRFADESRHQEVSMIAAELKAIARELDVPVVALSQLSRLVERREDKRPILSDLAESGSIEAEADLVCFLYRPSYYERRRLLEEASRANQPVPEAVQRPRGPDPAEIIIAKHRRGPTGTVNIDFHLEYRLFVPRERYVQSDESAEIDLLGGD
ncbi:MAG: replicative DNA helicase [Armatimonadetes bacterium]|nr:replicative DNA helicase [Armatimonadota bacterium]